MKLLQIPIVAMSLFGFGFLSGLDTLPAHGDFTFGKAQNLGPSINTSGYEEAPSLSTDGLTLYFNADQSGGYGRFDLWMTTRPTKDSPWGPPENLGPVVNSSAREQSPKISADGLSLYFNSTRPGGYGPALWGDIWVTTRATTSDPWSTPVNLGPIINSPSHAFGPSISQDSLSLFFGAERAGGSGNDDIWVSTRATADASWQEPVNLGPTVNSSAHEGAPSISADGLVLFFSDYALTPYRPGGYGNADIWMTKRASVSDPWGTPVNLGPPINTPAFDFVPNISADGSTLLFMSDRAGGYGNWDLWQAPILPVVDFSGDEVVAIQDLVLLIEHWDTEDPRYDIGPMPWGDGKVDANDLEVLMRYWGQEPPNPALIAHWKLDEVEGQTAHDSASSYTGTLHGDPVWQPTDGVKGGALQLDGVDDYVSTEKILDPATGPFSVFAWVRGGAPGRAIVSQKQGLNWLCADEATGALRTDLRQPGTGGRFAKPPGPPLISSAVITDGNWHRVGFVWEGSQRILYVDDVEVAQDTQVGLEPVTGYLHLGADGTLTPGGFWSGLVDDVRVCNWAVKP